MIALDMITLLSSLFLMNLYNVYPKGRINDPKRKPMFLTNSMLSNLVYMYTVLTSRLKTSDDAKKTFT